MTDWAIDASVTAKWLLTEADSPLARRAGSEIRATGGRLIVLDFGRAEVANVLRTQLRRRLLDEATARQLFAALQTLPVDVRPAAPLLADAFDRAVRYDVAVYDALFVALTVALGIPRLTADEPLYRAVHADHPQIHLLRNWPPQPMP
jgi:predicted nucleic acid-binding protein